MTKVRQQEEPDEVWLTFLTFFHCCPKQLGIHCFGQDYTIVLNVRSVQPQMRSPFPATNLSKTVIGRIWDRKASEDDRNRLFKGFPRVFYAVRIAAMVVSLSKLIRPEKLFRTRVIESCIIEI